MKQMHWVRADSSDFGGDRPAPRSGHTAVSIGKSKAVVFGGFADKRFLSDVSVYDVLRDHWRSSPASSLQLQELGPLLRDYQRLILQRYSGNPMVAFHEMETLRFFHLKSASQVLTEHLQLSKKSMEMLLHMCHLTRVALGITQ